MKLNKMRNYAVFEKSLSDAGVVVLRETKELMRNHWIVMTHNNDDDDCGGSELRSSFVTFVESLEK